MVWITSPGDKPLSDGNFSVFVFYLHPEEKKQDVTFTAYIQSKGKAKATERELKPDNVVEIPFANFEIKNEQVNWNGFDMHVGKS